MALDATKWEIRSDKKIRYTGGVHGDAAANYVSVLELHRFLQDRADDGTMSDDDFIDITVLNPTDKKFDTIIQLLNGFELDDAFEKKASEYIFGGTIIQGSGGTEAIYDGISIIANRGVVVNVIQNNTVLADKFWNNTPSGESFNGINPDEANGLAMQFMVKVKTGGAFIDNASLIFTTREWGKTYSEFRIPATGRGKNSVPLTFSDDLNNITDIGTIAALVDIVNVTAGFNLIDVDNNQVDEQYYSEWDKGGNVINVFYERMKWLTRNGYTTATETYGIPGEKFRGITHSVTYTGQAVGEFVEGGATPVSWGTGATAGTGQVLADFQNGTAGTLYIQLLTGVIPTGELTQGTTTANTGTVITRAVSTPMCGQSTGSSLVGAYGFSLEFTDLAVNDKITALDGVTRSPPNNVNFTVSGVADGWRVLVGQENGSGGLLETQLSNTGLLNAVDVTEVVVDEAIPANTPATGTIRIKRTDGRFTRHEYSQVTASPTTFTITQHDFSGNTAPIGADIYISYIDDVADGPTIAFNTIQSGGVQTLYVSARFGGTSPDYTDSIKPAATTGTLGATGGSATISSVSDV